MIMMTFELNSSYNISGICKKNKRLKYQEIIIKRWIENNFKNLDD